MALQISYYSYCFAYIFNSNNSIFHNNRPKYLIIDDFICQIGKQTLDQQQAEICNRAPSVQSIASTGLIVGIIMLALGIVLIIIGVLKEGTPKIRRET